MKANDRRGSLEHRLAEAEQNLRLINERISEYVLSTDVPPQLVKEKRQREQEIEELQAQLEQLNESFAAPDPLSLIEPGPRTPVPVVQALLEKARDALAQRDYDEAYRRCQVAESYAKKTTDSPGTALAELHLANLHSLRNRSKEGVTKAKQARKLFQLLGDKHNCMLAHIQLARLQYSMRDFSEAQQEYEDGLAICLRLQKDADGRRKRANYEELASTIQAGIDTCVAATRGEAASIADQVVHMCRLDSIPVLRPSDGPDALDLEQPSVGYITAGEFEIEGHPYFLHALKETQQGTVKLKCNALHFALPASAKWPEPLNNQGDFLLVQRLQRETRIAQEGPWVLWKGEEWVAYRFKRDLAAGIQFIRKQPMIIGDQRLMLGSVVALLKPVPYC